MSLKIRNMVERMKDNDDVRLESLFASESIEDLGFSAGVIKRVRRQIWVRRLALPVAFVVGGAIAFKPMVSLVTVLGGLFTAIPDGLEAKASLIPVDLMPAGTTILLGVMAIMIVTMIGKMLEE